MDYYDITRWNTFCGIPNYHQHELINAMVERLGFYPNLYYNDYGSAGWGFVLTDDEGSVDTNNVFMLRLNKVGACINVHEDFPEAQIIPLIIYMKQLMFNEVKQPLLIAAG